MNDLEITLAFDTIRNKFNKYRHLREDVFHFESLVPKMSVEEKEKLLYLLNMEDHKLLVTFKTHVMTEIIRRDTLARAKEIKKNLAKEKRKEKLKGKN